MQGLLQKQYALHGCACILLDVVISSAVCCAGEKTTRRHNARVNRRVSCPGITAQLSYGLPKGTAETHLEGAGSSGRSLIHAPRVLHRSMPLIRLSTSANDVIIPRHNDANLSLYSIFARV
jgi:hypothetical protein